jgi:hypothetical protein
LRVPRRRRSSWRGGRGVTLWGAAGGC